MSTETSETWNQRFLNFPEWEPIRRYMDPSVLEGWTELSEASQRTLVQSCARKYREEFSVIDPEKARDPWLDAIESGEAFSEPLSPEEVPSYMVLPEPLEEEAVPWVEADPGVPGEIQVDAQGKLLKKYLNFTGFTRFLRESYDDWIQPWLPEQIKQFPLKISGGQIRFHDVTYVPPMLWKKGRAYPLLPREARKLNLTYGLEVYAKATIEDTEGHPIQTFSVNIGTLPLMLGSSQCHLYGKTVRERMEMGEDPSDPMGYFIVEGVEKVILLQEKLRLNRIFVVQGKKSKEALFTVETDKGTSRMELQVSSIKHVRRIVFSTRPKARKRSKETMTIFSRKKKDKSLIPIEDLFFVLGVETASEMLERLLEFTRLEWRSKVKAFLSLSAALFPSNREITYHEVAVEKGVYENLDDPEKVAQEVEEMIRWELFPHLNELADVREAKISMLALLTIRLVEVELGLAPLEDRDSWSNKRLETPGRMMHQLFRNAWRMYRNNIVQKLRDKTILHGSEIENLVTDTSFLTTTFLTSFRGPNWGVSNMVKNNITQTLRRDSIVSMYSHLTRIDVETNRKDKRPSIRMVHGTQYGYICPVETPENANCGIVKNLAVTARISLFQDDRIWIALLKPFLSKHRTSEFSTIVLVNGKFLGWCEGNSLRTTLISYRRTGRIPDDAAVVLDRRGTLHLHTDASRLVRPLLVVEKVERRGQIRYEPVISTLNLWGASIPTLKDEQALEYVDAWEAEYIQLAVSLDSIQERQEMDMELESIQEEARQRVSSMTEDVRRLEEQGKSGEFLRPEWEDLKRQYDEVTEALQKHRAKTPFTHVELDPSSILGIAASIIPYPNYNQAPRNTFQTSMGKQALGMIRSAEDACYNPTHKVLAFPTRPLFEPQLNQLLHLNAYPQGEMVVVAFGTFTGFTQEDAFIFNKASIERGKFRMVKYITYHVTFKSENNQVEMLGMPSGLSKTKLETTYRHLIHSGPNKGLPNLGAEVHEKEAILGKIVMENEKEIANESLFLKVGEDGVIDSVVVTGNDTEMIVILRLRAVRMPIAGDKFAPRNAQKGTIGLVLPQEDMPRTGEGIIPDLIINPHSMPSRMTMAYMLEIIASKAGAIRGERVNATAFRKFDYESFKAILRDYGYQQSVSMLPKETVARTVFPDGKEILFSGITGKPLPMRIFIGPVYFQMLRHNVLDKIQARSVGQRSALTLQPTKGRALEGGLRVGEMERDAFISHGASFLLKERMCGVADCYKTLFCRCGHFAYSNQSGGYSCRNCGELASFGEIEFTYGFKLVSNMLAGFGIKQVFNLETQEEYLEDLEQRGIYTKEIVPEIEEEEALEEEEAPEWWEEEEVLEEFL